MGWFSRRHPEFNVSIEGQVLSLAKMIAEYKKEPQGSYSSTVKLSKINARLRALKNSLE